MLKRIHDASQYRVVGRERGRWIEERRQGTKGRRKRASWWGIRERRTRPEMALRKGRRGGVMVWVIVGRRVRAGPRRRGREARRC